MQFSDNRYNYVYSDLYFKKYIKRYNIKKC